MRLNVGFIETTSVLSGALRDMKSRSPKSELIRDSCTGHSTPSGALTTQAVLEEVSKYSLETVQTVTVYSIESTILSSIRATNKLSWQYACFTLENARYVLSDPWPSSLQAVLLPGVGRETKVHPRLYLLLLHFARPRQEHERRCLAI